MRTFQSPADGFHGRRNFKATARESPPERAHPILSTTPVETSVPQSAATRALSSASGQQRRAPQFAPAWNKASMGVAGAMAAVAVMTAAMAAAAAMGGVTSTRDRRTKEDQGGPQGGPRRTTGVLPCVLPIQEEHTENAYTCTLCVLPIQEEHMEEHKEDQKADHCRRIGIVLPAIPRGTQTRGWQMHVREPDPSLCSCRRPSGHAHGPTTWDQRWPVRPTDPRTAK